jgi:phage tail-like protein
MRNDPYSKFNFLIQLGPEDVGGFTEVSGLTAESDIIEYREGSDPPRNRKLPALTKFSNITLKRGYTQSRALWEWRKTTLDGMTERRDGAIVMLDEARNEVLRWEFFEGWVSKYEGPALNATANEAAIESIEIAIEYLQLAE